MQSPQGRDHRRRAHDDKRDDKRDAKRILAADAIANAAKKSAPKGRTMKLTVKVERFAMNASESLRWDKTSAQ